MTEIKFDDGAAYERYMGVWSQAAGDQFLDWLRPQAGLRWLDVGCGNGAFTATLLERCAPASVDGIDPSEAQLAHARARFTSQPAQFHQGDAMALPFPDHSFDAAVMPLVIFFVPSPAKGVAEMARVVKPGGLVTAYGWDLDGGGFPYQAMREEIAALGGTVPEPPSPDAAGLEQLRTRWEDAGLSGIETHELTVHRTYDSFDDYWAIASGGPSVGAALKTMPPDALPELRARMQQRLTPGNQGRITCSARANAVRGSAPSATSH